MRLIDADKLKRIYAQSPSAPLPSFVTGSEIDNAPTVNAIPIEFLEKWFGDNYNALTDLEIAWEKENETN